MLKKFLTAILSVSILSFGCVHNKVSAFSPETLSRVVSYVCGNSEVKKIYMNYLPIWVFNFGPNIWESDFHSVENYCYLLGCTADELCQLLNYKTYHGNADNFSSAQYLKSVVCDSWGDDQSSLEVYNLHCHRICNHYLINEFISLTKAVREQILEVEKDSKLLVDNIKNCSKTFWRNEYKKDV